jgi:hypothetical protein
MTRKSDILHRRLPDLESEFRLLLPPGLKQCAAGRWRLFGQNDHIEESKYLHWPEVYLLKTMAHEIPSIRQDFGQTDPVVERFLHSCSLRGANVPGEPKLARLLLDEVECELSAPPKV